MEQYTAPAFDLLHDIVGNGHRASRYARMNAPDRSDKYTTIHEALTDAQLHEHLLGRSTYAAIIIGADELVSAACIELDTDALGGARRVLETASGMHITAFSIAVKGAGDHDGSHTWILFHDRVQPDRAAHLARQIATDAGYADAEIWPKGNAIRLPFGIHTHTQQRGRLVLQTGETYDLNDSDQLSMGAAATAALPKNAAPPNIVDSINEVKTTVYIVNSCFRRTAGRASLDDVKARFNAEHTLDSLLTSWGAVQTKDGYTCVCGVQHTHETTLYISKKGRLFSFSPRCTLHTTKGYDAFGLYVKLYHNDNVVDALKTLNPIAPRRKSVNFTDPPLVEPEPRRSQAERDADRQRKNAANAAAAAEVRDAVEAYVATHHLPPCDRKVVDVMLTWAADHNSSSCWLGRATIARLSGYSLGSVKRSVMHLEALGYFESTGHGGRSIDTARRNFSRGSLFATRTICVSKNDPRMVITSDDLVQDLELVSAAPPQQPEAWELWEASDSECCGWDVQALEKPQVAVFEPESEPIEADPAHICAENLPKQEILAASEPAQEPGGASYDPYLDITQPRRRAARPPKERDAYAKSRRQARFKAMGPPELRREWIILSRKADKSKGSQRYALKEQVAEIECYLAIKDARLDRAMAPPEMPPPHQLAPEGRPLTLAMDLSQPTVYTAGYVSGLVERLRQVGSAVRHE